MFFVGFVVCLKQLTRSKTVILYLLVEHMLIRTLRRSAKDVVPPDGRNVDPEEVEEKASRILESISDLREAIPQAEVALGDSREVLESYLAALTTSTIEIRDELIHGESERPVTANDTYVPPLSAADTPCIA